MRFIVRVILGFVTILMAAGAGAQEPADGLPREGLVACWTFDDIRGARVGDGSGHGHEATVLGQFELASGVRGHSLRLDGSASYAAVPDAGDFDFSAATFSITAWANVYALNRGQQMIVAKNVYSANQREWGLMVDHDNQFRFYLQHGDWRTLGSKCVPKPGRWHHVAVTVDAGNARLYVDGRLEGKARLGPTVPHTAAPLTIGGVNDGGRLRQMWQGALDDVCLYGRALSQDQIRAVAKRETTPHEVPQTPEPYVLWTDGLLPASAEIPVLEGVRFSVIKPHEPQRDGGNWLLGVALAWHEGKLYASYGFNTGAENTASEQAHVRVSEDGGRTWGGIVTIDAGEGNRGVSHGVFLSHRDKLWAFHGAFYDDFQRTHTRAYVLDEATGQWRPKGVVIEEGFWPMQEPLKMQDGNWIMAGARVSFGYRHLAGHLPAVAISHGEDFTRWDLVVIPSHASVPANSIWGESTVLVDETRITNVSRWGRPLALASHSTDSGRTWAPAVATNLPMAASKPYCGTLSTGQNYLIGTTTADSGNRRSPLTIAVSRPGQKTFSRVFVIRHAVFPAGPGPSRVDASLCYPYAVEHDGQLYVGYAVKNYRTAELAVIPLEQLR